MEPDLTPGEIEIMRNVKKNGGSLLDAKMAVAASREGRQSPLLTDAIFTRDEDEGFSIEETIGDIGQAVVGAGKQFGQGVQRASESQTAWMQDDTKTLGEAFTTGKNIVGEVAGGIARGAGELFLGVGKAAVTQEREDKIAKSFMENVAMPIANTETVQGLRADYEWLRENDPVEFRKVRADMALLEAAVELVGMKGVGSGVKRAATEGIDAVVRAGRSLRPTTVVGEVVEDVAEGVGRTAIGTGTVVGDTANIVTDNTRRAITHLQDRMKQARAKQQAIREAPTPEIRAAVKADVPERQVRLITTADDATRNSMSDMYFHAAGDNREAIGKIIADTGAAQYRAVDARRAQIGQEIETAINNLPDGVTVDMRPAYAQFDDLLRDNKVVVGPGGRLDFGPSNFSKAESKVVREIYDKVHSRGDTLDPIDLQELDSLLSRIQREAYQSTESSVPYVNVNGERVNFTTLARDIYRSPLDNMPGQPGVELRALNNQYRQYRNFVDDLDETLFKTSRNLNISVPEGATVETRLRRVFSNAQSRAEYEAIVDELDRLARMNGYNGADLKSLGEFELYLQKIFADQTTQPASFSGGIRQAFGDIMRIGQPDATDQQKAIQALLEAPTGTQVPTPPTTTRQPVSSTNTSTSDATNPTLAQRAKEFFNPDLPNKEGGMLDIGEILKDLEQLTPGARRTQLQELAQQQQLLYERALNPSISQSAKNRYIKEAARIGKAIDRAA